MIYDFLCYVVAMVIKCCFEKVKMFTSITVCVIVV